jgi:hypothetical protein
VRRKKTLSKIYSNSYLKVSLFDEYGRKLYKTQGKPKNCINDALFNLTENFQLIDKEDIDLIRDNNGSTRDNGIQKSKKVKNSWKI